MKVGFEAWDVWAAKTRTSDFVKAGCQGRKQVDTSCFCYDELSWKSLWSQRLWE